MYGVYLYVGDSFQVLAARSRFVAVLVCKYKAQCRQHAYACVVRGAAANAYQKRTAPLFHGVDNDLTYSIGRRVKRIAFFFRYKMQTGRSSHFYNGQRSFSIIGAGYDAVLGLYRFSQWITDGYAMVRTSQPLQKGRNGAFASVG